MTVLVKIVSRLLCVWGYHVDDLRQGTLYFESYQGTFGGRFSDAPIIWRPKCTVCKRVAA